MDLKSKHNSGVRKRPEIALYKPGMGKILGKKGENDSNVPQKQDFSEDLKQDIRQKSEEKCESFQTEVKENKLNNNNNNNKNVIKKPDIQVYVPRKLNNNNLSENNSDEEKIVVEKHKQQNLNQNHERNHEKVHERNEKFYKNHERSYEKSYERNNDKNHEKSYERNNDKSHEKSYERNDRNHEKPFERNNDKNHEKSNDRNSDKSYERNYDKNHERKQQNPKSVNYPKKHDYKNVERNTNENSSKMSNNFDSLKRKVNKSEVSAKYSDDYEDYNRKSKPVEHKYNHNISENSNRVSKTEKLDFNEEYDENYYNYELRAKNNRIQRPNRNYSINNSNNNPNYSMSSNTGSNSYNESNKSRLKHDNVKQRNYTSNKTQHRYQYEQQIPPRFLKKQQMLKKQMENEIISEEQTQKTHYEERRQESPQEEKHHSNQSESFPHRGLIRLPATNKISPQELNPHFNHKTEHHNSQQIKFESKTPLISNKPCVAIRPTQHVPTDDYSQYSPASSPDRNSVFTNTTSDDNYQQMSPYMRSSYTEYPIPHIMSSTPAENDSSRIQSISEILRKKLKPIIEKSFTEAIAAENDLHLCINDQQKVEQIRYRIQLRYEHIILTDLRVCAEYNIEQRLWKSAFYQFIEHYRRLIEQNSEQSQEMKTAFHKIVDEATLFFENLLVKMQETYNFGIERLLTHEYDRETENYDLLKLAAISAQKIYLYLGDLSRYKECEVRNSSFVKSKFYYVRAQQLAPKNGRSYNQLALLAMYQNRRLDAVYYYMRSLAASNPFLTARENLLAIFDEIRRKYELTDKKRKQDLINKKNRIESELLASDNERIEIWIRSDGTSAVCSNYKQFFEEETARDELEVLSSVDLNKRFVLSFLHVHGKLFSKVGMETFVPVVNQMLSEFHCLLRRSPIPVSSQRLSHLLAINMFAVFNTSLKDTSYGHNCRSLLQEQAIQVTFAMMSLLLNRAISSLSENKRVETHPNFNSDDLSELLPTIKLWTDWMSCQKHLWCPPPASSDFKINCKADIWTIFAQFLTALTRINVRSVKLLPSKLEGCEPVILPEDTSLAGFLPLLGSPQCVQFAQPPYDKEKARTCLRITVIQFFGDYLCGIVEPYLKFDVENKRFVSLIPTSIPSNSEEMINKTSNEDISETENDDYSNELSSGETTSISISDYNPKSPEQIEIEQLWSRQEALKKAKERQEIIKQRVDAVLSEENQNKPSRIVIQPRYIIPDTNCFIDHLPKIKALIESKYYDLIIPLIVINELNGLKSRGIKTTKPLTFSDDHSGHVGRAAMETIDYLVSAFNDKNLRLKAITSKGSLLDNINFISETFSETQGNSNDDFILGACLQFIKDKPLDKNSKESSVESNSIFREAILLTEDRNLRVKALGHNVPVKSLPVFIKWANIPIKSNRVQK